MDLETSRQRFGELRSLLQHAPSRTIWAQCCALAEQFEPHLFEQEILPYMLGRLRHWPDALRVVPRRWLVGMIEGEPLPWMPCARYLRIEHGMPISDPVFEMLARHEGMSHITMLEVSPNQKVYLSAVRLLLQSPHLSQLRHLSLSNMQLQDKSLRHVMAQTACRCLETLDVANNLLGRDTVIYLSDYGWAQQLRALNLSSNPMGDVGVRALSRTGRWRRLDTLELSDIRMGAAGMSQLATAPILEQLHTLVLDHNAMYYDGVGALAQSDRLPALTHLSLGGVQPGLAGVRALCRSSFWSQLQVLSLRGDVGFGLGDRGVEVLASVDFDVKRLDLSQNQLRRRSIERMVGAPWFGQLGFLDVSDNRLDDASVDLLLQHTNQDILKDLRLANNPVSVSFMDRLGDRHARLRGLLHRVASGLQEHSSSEVVRRVNVFSRSDTHRSTQT